MSNSKRVINLSGFVHCQKTQMDEGLSLELGYYTPLKCLEYTYYYLSFVTIKIIYILTYENILKFQFRMINFLYGRTYVKGRKVYVSKSERIELTVLDQYKLSEYHIYIGLIFIFFNCHQNRNVKASIFYKSSEKQVLLPKHGCRMILYGLV